MYNTTLFKRSLLTINFRFITSILIYISLLITLALINNIFYYSFKYPYKTTRILLILNHMFN